MTTPIPTNSDPLAQAGVSPQLDLTSLSQMANAFFQALPGTTPDFSRLTEVPAPAAPQGFSPRSAAPVMALAPAGLPVAPAATPAASFYFLADENRYGKSPAGFSRPQAPEVNELPVSVPRTQAPAAMDASNPYLQYTEQPVDAVDRVSPQAFGLPGERELLALLGDARQLTSSAPAQTKSSQDYYFLASPPQNSVKAQPALDVNAIRRDFPILAERVNGRPLIWFDNAATTHKPQAVIDRLAYFYAHENSNIHRAAHELAARATDAYEGARQKAANFLGAASPDEIVFVRGATEAINLIANTFGRDTIGQGDEIIVSLLEHHANIVPWYMLAQSVGATIRVIPVDDSGQLRLDEYRKLLNSRTKLVAVTQVSNALGTVTPIKEVIALAHSAGVRVLVDGAQAVSHMPVNVQALDADFYVFSGHKVFGPTGIGVVYGKAELLKNLRPWQGGGNMIADVSFDRVIYQEAPARLEAGTGNIADAVGLGAAIDYVQRIGLDRINRYEHDLLEYATAQLQTIRGLRLIGTAEDKASVASFVLDGYKTEEVGHAFNREGIAVRSGHHCAQPILRRFGVEATVRPSLAFYNTCEEVDVMINVLRRLTAHKR